MLRDEKNHIQSLRLESNLQDKNPISHSIEKPIIRFKDENEDQPHGDYIVPLG
jgi:hypothetical protein